MRHSVFYANLPSSALPRCNRRVLFYIVKWKVCYCNHHALHESCKDSGAGANFVVFGFRFPMCDVVLVCY